MIRIYTIYIWIIGFFPRHSALGNFTDSSFESKYLRAELAPRDAQTALHIVQRTIDSSEPMAESTVMTASRNRVGTGDGTSETVQMMVRSHEIGQTF